MRTLAILTLISGLSLAAPQPFQDLDLQAGVEGRIQFGRGQVGALLHSVNGTWALAVRPSAGRLSDLIPGIKGTVADEFEASDPVVVFSTGRVRAPLAGAARRFYGLQTLDLEKGVNLITAVRPRPGSSVDRALRLVGLNLRHVVLTGVVLRDFDYTALKEAKEAGKLKKALVRGTMLKAALPEFRLKGLPKSFRTGRAYLFVTGEPGAGVGFGMTTADGRDFDCDLSIRKDDKGVTEVVIAGSSRGRWANALGIKGFHLDDARLLLSVDATQNVGFGLRAAMAIGRKRMMIAGKVELNALTGVPTGGFFEGSINSLGSADLIAFANAVKGPKARSIAAGDLPDFGLRDVYIRYAPMGGDARLGVKSGMALKGKLHALGKQLAYVDGELDQSGIVPTVKLKGEIADFRLGVVALRDAMVDVYVGPSADSHFRVKGSSQMWISKKSIDVDISRRRFYFELHDSLAGIYRAYWKAASPARGRPSWNAEVAFTNDLTRSLEKGVAPKAMAWANKTEQDFNKAKRGLDIALQRLNSLDKSIDAARAKVRTKRARHEAAIRNARAEVARLDGLIRARHAQLDAGIAKIAREVSSRKRTMDRAYKAWRAAVAATKRAKPWEKPKKKAIEAKKYAAYKKAQAAWNSARARLAVAKKKADPALGSLVASRKTAGGVLTAALKAHQLATKGLPVDADPSVAGLIASKVTAQAAVKTARFTVDRTGKAVAGAARITAYAAKHNGKILMVDQVRASGQIASSLAGTKAGLTVNVRWLGQSKQVRLRGSLDDIRRGRLVSMLWSQLKAGL